MNWKIGDRAIIIQSRYPSRVGTHVTIMSELIYTNPISGVPLSRPMHVLDIENAEYPEYPAFYRPAWLGPIPDNGSWSELEKSLKWNPSKLVTVESNNARS